ncbi:MAG: SprB repeat-containing protein [Bacteroidales bacterium]|nr:SprB repeat-containing protein [Bacteroidales bacterium]
MTIEVLSAPTLGLITHPTCANATGSVVLTGLPAGNWTINPGSISGSGPNTTITGLSAGTYNYSVTNAAGCTSLLSADIVIDSQPVIPTAPVNGGITQPTCADPTGGVLLNGLPGSGTWTINPGSVSGTGTSQTISGLAPGIYNYTVTNSDGCISPATTLTVNNIPTAPTASTNVTNASSVGASDGAIDLTVTGGTAPYSFSWSNGATTEDISGLNAGTYSVTITDANGCTTSASATVNENAAPINTSTVVTNVTCNGDADGAINLTVTGGTPPYSFSWSNGDATEDISGLSAGTYNVTITDNDGTTANASATVSEPSALNTATNVTDASSVGASDGAVDLTVTGGTAPYSFSWSNGATTEDISGLNAGTYSVTITDANGCTTSASATVNENAAAINTSTAVTNVTCNGDADGAINLTVTGGTPPYSFSWSNGDATEDISGLSAGTYNVTITDNDGTTANASATISEPSALNTATNVTDASSVGASDGAIDLTVTGGTAPYSFSWSNGATTEDISGLNAGTYSVTITDANGCTTSASATVSENASAINTSTAVTNVTCNGDADGAINLTVTGGTPPYSFSWSNGDATEDISGLSAGTYNVTITDNDGTTANASATVSEPSALNTATNVTDASSVGASDGAVDLTVTGGTAPYSFSWSNGATTEDISGLNAGTYNVTITDANGCTTSASATVSENASR